VERDILVRYKLQEKSVYSIFQTIYNVLNQSGFGSLFGPKGTKYNDNLNGTKFDDKIDALAGDDLIHGRFGNDKINAGDGNDKAWGDDGNDILDGGKGNDELYGGDGKDTTIGGKGNDKHDGGAGIDTAIFSGPKSQYLIYRDNDENIVVEHSVNGGDGIDILDNVELIKFGNAPAVSLEQLALPQTVLNTVLDVTGTNGNGSWLNGSGIPATGVVQQDSGHHENSQMFAYRQGSTIQPTGVDPDGEINFVGPSGPQVIDPAHNVSAANAGRGAIAIGVSFNHGANGPGGMTAEQFYDAGGKDIWRLDLDPSPNVNFLNLESVYNPTLNPTGSNTVFVAMDNNWAAQGITQGTVIATDNGGNQFAVQQFTNLAFFNNLIDHDPNVAGIQGGPIAPAGSYEFVSEQIGVTGVLLTSIHTELTLV